MELYDRKNGTLRTVPEVGGGAIRFVYGTAVGRVLAKGILCRKFVSDAYAAWQKSRFSRGKTRRFIARYGVDVSDCTETEFACFHDFFTRQRKNYVNQTQPNELPAVADAKLTALPISRDSRFSIKGVPYTLTELLDDAEAAARFEGGTCLIFRLAPEDYHHYVYPDKGTCDATQKIAGVLHTVNPIAADMGVYRRNTRCFTRLHTEHFGEMIQMEVGALLVGRIVNRTEQPAAFEKLEEKGHFAYGGSMVILLAERGALTVDADIWEQSRRGVETLVRLGERVAVRAESAPKSCFRFFQNRDCEYFPCHAHADPQKFNCLFCYCPLYALGDRCGGNFTYTKDGIKDCSACLFPHAPQNYPQICKRFGDICALVRKPPMSDNEEETQ